MPAKMASLLPLAPPTGVSDNAAINVTPGEIDYCVNDTAATLRRVLDSVALLKKRFTHRRTLAPWYTPNNRNLKQASRQMKKMWRSSRSADSQNPWKDSLLTDKIALLKARTAY